MFLNQNSLRIHSTALLLRRFGLFRYRQSPSPIRIRALLGDVLVFIKLSEDGDGATDRLDGRVHDLESPAKALLLVPLNRALAPATAKSLTLVVLQTVLVPDFFPN